jgi:hypothetical protein
MLPSSYMNNFIKYGSISLTYYGLLFVMYNLTSGMHSSIFDLQN